MLRLPDNREDDVVVTLVKNEGEAGDLEIRYNGIAVLKLNPYAGGCYFVSLNRRQVEELERLHIQIENGHIYSVFPLSGEEKP